MTKKEKEVIKNMNLHPTHAGGFTFIQGVLPTVLYNSIMSSKPGPVKPKTPPKPPAWAVPLIANVATLMANQAEDHALLMQVSKNQAADHALLVQLKSDFDDHIKNHK